ncbi:MAG: fibronectin type III domain-containing protein [Gemmataceae bacterium]|nr:fibronectin type III domain-containing protein [Gemmataceae bacterium]
MAKSSKPPAPKKAPAKPVKKTTGKSTGLAAQSLAPDPAKPKITSPGNGDHVPPGVDLTVQVDTNRDDLRYIVELTDTTTGASVKVYVPAPTGGRFTAVFAGSNLQPDRTYTIRVYVNPLDGATPPNLDATITVETNTQQSLIVARSDDPAYTTAPAV